MAKSRLTDSLSGLNPSSSIFLEKLSNETWKERLYLSVSQLNAVVQIALRTDLTQFSELILYSYFTMMEEKLEYLEVICEWLGRQEFSESTDNNNSEEGST